MASAAILCTQCGAASATPLLSQCAKCGGNNARVCAGCGFQNSLAKNYCDKCGNPISDLGTIIAPPPATAIPGAPKSNIPETVVKHIPPAAGHQAHDLFATPSVSNDPWSPIVPPQPKEAPKPPRWLGLLRRTLTTAFATAAVIASLVTVWYWSEHNKPENAVHRAAVLYLDALQARDYAAAYSQFSDLARKYCTLDEFRASRDTSTWTWSGLRIEHAEPGAMLLAYELTIAGAPPRTDRVLFVEEITKGTTQWVRPYSWALILKVEESFDKNNADMGLVLAQAAATVNPRDPMARGYLCEAAYYRKSPADTERQCVTAIELARIYPSNLSRKSLYHLHAILADTYKNALHKPDLALNQFAQMLAFPRISPADQCEILLARSEAYMTLGRPGETLSDVDRAGQLCVRPQDLSYIKEIRRKLNVPNQ